MGILDADFHKEIMRMLPINNGLPECGFACLKQKRISSVSHCCGLKADHATEHHTASAKFVNRPEHTPVGRVELIGSTGAAELLGINQESLAHPHQVPITRLIHPHGH